MRRSMPRRAVQALAVALLGGSASMLLLPAGGAHAAGATSAKPAVTQQAWYWQNAYEQANPPVAAQPPATEPSGVPTGDLAVAFTGNSDKSSSKTTALAFDIPTLQPGATVQQFTFTLTLDTQPSATSYNTVGATVVACLPTRLWPAVLGGDYTNQPTVDCSKKVAPTVSGNTYTFKIPAIAQSWIDDQNLGVAIVADPDKTVAPFQLVFTGAKTVHASMLYLPALSSTSAATTTSGAGAASGATAPAASGTTTGGAPAAGDVPLPPTASDNTGTAAAPVVAGAPTVAPATKQMAAVKPASAVPTAAFWFAGVVLALVLLAASLVLGDPQPAPAAATRSRLDRVLRDRHADLLTVRRV